MLISTHLLLVIIIYPSHSDRAPFRPWPGWGTCSDWPAGSSRHLVCPGYYAVCWLLPCGQSRLPCPQPKFRRTRLLKGHMGDLPG